LNFCSSPAVSEEENHNIPLSPFYAVTVGGGKEIAQELFFTSQPAVKCEAFSAK
jgi:hypothetical protein